MPVHQVLIRIAAATLVGANNNFRLMFGTTSTHHRIRNSFNPIVEICKKSNYNCISVKSDLNLNSTYLMHVIDLEGTGSFIELILKTRV